MARVKKNQMVRGISGGLGGLVFRQMPDGSTYVSTKPDFSRRKFSQGQKKHQSRFQQAVAYAREASKSQPIYAELARGTIMSAYNIALSDWFNPPVIDAVERRDGVVRVQASDAVLVTRVTVTLLNAEGGKLETGNAEMKDGNWWEFSTNTQGTVLVEAFDLAGNVTKAEVGN